MIILSDNQLKENLIKYFKSKNVEIKNKMPIEIMNQIVLYFATPINVNSIDNYFLNDLADNIIKKIDEDKKYKINNKYKKIERVLDIRTSKWYSLKIKFNDKIIPLMIKINRKYNYIDIFLIDLNRSNDYCGHCRFMNKNEYINYNRAYIYWIKTNNPNITGCGIDDLTGNNVLSFFKIFSKILNIKTMELEESATRFCPNIKTKNNQEYVKYYTSIYDWIRKGQTWYERKGFKPSPEKYIRDYDRFMLPMKKDISNDKKNEKFYMDYKNNIKLLQEIKIRDLINIYNDILNKIPNYFKKINQVYSKDVIINFSFCLYYMNTFMNTNQKDNLSNFIIWLFNLDCYIYYIFINSLIIYADMWSIDKKEDFNNIHFYNKFLKNKLISKIEKIFLFLTLRNYFYLNIDDN